jgi:hypothetical protein
MYWVNVIVFILSFPYFKIYITKHSVSSNFEDRVSVYVGAVLDNLKRRVKVIPVSAGVEKLSASSRMGGEDKELIVMVVHQSITFTTLFLWLRTHLAASSTEVKLLN